MRAISFTRPFLAPFVVSFRYEHRYMLIVSAMEIYTDTYDGAILGFL